MFTKHTLGNIFNDQSMLSGIHNVNINGYGYINGLLILKKMLAINKKSQKFLQFTIFRDYAMKIKIHISLLKRYLILII